MNNIEKITVGGTTYDIHSSKEGVSNGTALSLVTTGEKYNWNNKTNGLTVGSATVNTLANLPTTKSVVIATISSNLASVSISGGVASLPAGYELHVIIQATANVTITLPTSSPYVNCNIDNTLKLTNGDYAEINFISSGTNIYVRSIV